MRDLKKKLIALFVVTGMILSVVSCRNKTAEESSQTEETTAVTTAVREETPAETTVTELVEPDYPVLAADENSITFNDGDDLYTAHCDGYKNFEDDESDCRLSVAEYKGERQLKIEVLDFDEKSGMYKVPKIVFDVDELVGSENLSKVKSFSCDITQVAAGEFEGEDGEMLFVPGNLMGTFGSVLGEDCDEWYEPTGSSNSYAKEEWNFEWEYLHVEGKWLIKGFVDGTENSTLVFLRWGIPNQADIYLDNLTFYDEGGNSIPIVYTPGMASEGTETSPEETEISPEDTQEDTEVSSDEEKSEEDTE